MAENSGRTILLVEDDEDMRALVAAGLRDTPYHLIAAADGEEGLARLASDRPDLVLLDVFLGKDSIDGLEVCRRMRAQSRIPIIFLTTRGDEVDQVIGLMAGADDYVTKPVAPRLLEARIDAVLRRAEDVPADGGAVLERAGMRIDLAARTVTVGGTDVPLTRTEFDLLAALAERPGWVLSRDSLVETVWGGWYGSDEHLDVHMSRLRKKVLAVGGPRVGHAVRGVGFRLTA